MKFIFLCILFKKLLINNKLKTVFNHVRLFHVCINTTPSISHTFCFYELEFTLYNNYSIQQFRNISSCTCTSALHFVFTF